MKQQQLQETLTNLVSSFGYENVRKTLGAMRSAKSVTAKRAAIRRGETAQLPATPDKKKTKPDAVRVAQSLAITDDEKKKILFQLAEKYEAKEFMPNVNHVRDFLNDGERDVSRIKSRQQVTVAVFKQLGGLETGKLREMLDRGLYGPPKRLAPYARAIEGFRRPNRPA